jgi:hypothetical protein
MSGASPFAFDGPQFVAVFAWGTVYGGEAGEAWRYGRKHANRFGAFLHERPADEADPIDAFRLTYSFTDESPARQRYLGNRERKTLRRGQMPLGFFGGKAGAAVASLEVL